MNDVKKNDAINERAGVAPDLQTRTVVGVFDTVDQAEAAVAQLQTEGFSFEDLSVVMRPSGTPPEMDADETKAEKAAIAGASAGALLGGAIGLIALTIPGLGPLLAAGPLAAAISGALAGGALGAWVGSIVGLGIPTEHAEEYAQAVRTGGIFMAIKVPDEEAGEHAEHILSTHGARQVANFVQL